MRTDRRVRLIGRLRARPFFVCFRWMNPLVRSNHIPHEAQHLPLAHSGMKSRGDEALKHPWASRYKPVRLGLILQIPETAGVFAPR